MSKEPLFTVRMPTGVQHVETANAALVQVQHDFDAGTLALTFRDKGRVSVTIKCDVEGARKIRDAVARLLIRLDS